jgi:hypothetical protein
MKLATSLLFGVLMLPAMHAAGQVPLPVTPNWVSTDGDYSTGAALVDINQDGWLDLVVANGNDMARQHLVVYFNKKDGTFPTVPDWQSADIDYHGHIAVGDVNGDGYPDIAVSVYLGAGEFGERGYVKLYMNDQGSLESRPSWRSVDSLYTFSCAFGDANGDGAPDLAVACGESYGFHAEKDRIYLNRGGRLDSLPSWKSQQAGYSLDVGWGDFDNDGRLDLVFANERGPNTMYKNYGDSMGTVPLWQSADSSLFANSLALGDLTNDSFPDLAVSDNNQLGGTGHFKVYLNNGGKLNGSPDWSSASSGMGSGIALLDITNDGWRDLICGGWWEACRVFPNLHGVFNQVPSWSTTTTSVVEAIVAGDVDNAGLDTERVSYIGDGFRKLYMIPKAPVQRLFSVIAGHTSLPLTAYCCDLENGWISLAAAPERGDTLQLEAVVSHSLDVAVSNWDVAVGNYLFMNTNGVTSVAGREEKPRGFELMQNYPNPFNPKTGIRFRVSGAGEAGSAGLGLGTSVKLIVYDLLGREVAVLVNERKAPGNYEVRFDASGLSSGVYFYRLTAGSFAQTRSMILVK